MATDARPDHPFGTGTPSPFGGVNRESEKAAAPVSRPLSFGATYAASHRKSSPSNPGGAAARGSGFVAARSARTEYGRVFAGRRGRDPRRGGGAVAAEGSGA